MTFVLGANPRGRDARRAARDARNAAVQAGQWAGASPVRAWSPEEIAAENARRAAAAPPPPPPPAPPKPPTRIRPELAEGAELRAAEAEERCFYEEHARPAVAECGREFDDAPPNVCRYCGTEGLGTYCTPACEQRDRRGE